MSNNKPIIREDLPSGGHAEHTHVWQMITEDATSMTLVCQKDGCSATKQVPKPKAPQNESTSRPPVLCG